MAIGTLAQVAFAKASRGDPRPMAAVSPVSNWIVVHADVTAADNGGSAITIPSTQIISSNAHVLDCLGCGTLVALVVQYTATRTLNTAPVCNLFGLASVNGVVGSDGINFTETGTSTRHTGIPTPLRTSPALSYDWTFSGDATNDANDGTFKYTAPQIVDLMGLPYFLAGVKTAAVLSGAGTAKLLARFF